MSHCTTFLEREKMAYLKRAHEEFGVRNFEMEATMLLAFAKRANISGMYQDYQYFELFHISVSMLRIVKFQVALKSGLLT